MYNKRPKYVEDVKLPTGNGNFPSNRIKMIPSFLIKAAIFDVSCENSAARVFSFTDVTNKTERRFYLKQNVSFGVGGGMSQYLYSLHTSHRHNKVFQSENFEERNHLEHRATWNTQEDKIKIFIMMQGTGVIVLSGLKLLRIKSSAKPLLNS